VGAFAGAAFVVLGVLVFVPLFGIFGVVWTLAALAITLYYGFNAWSGKGVPLYRADVDREDAMKNLDEDLRRLERLRADGLLNETEYERQRAALLRR
jgi:hypothetical protein